MPARPVPQRLVAALVIAAALAFACGPRARSSDANREDRSVSGPPIAASLNVRVADAVAFAFLVTNNAPKRLELNFASGQTHDLVVLDSVGREVWRWSEGRLFTQAMQNTVLETSETLAYEAEWRPSGAQRGEFVAVATLLSENHPVEQRVTFSVP